MTRGGAASPRRWCVASSERRLRTLTSGWAGGNVGRYPRRKSGMSCSEVVSPLEGEELSAMKIS